MMDQGPRLSPEECQRLIEPFTMKELDDALCNINTHKAPGTDGLNSCVYKNVWVDIQEDNLKHV